MSIDKISQNVVRVDVEIDGIEGNGSGLLVNKDGIIYTCDHVIRPNNRNANSIKIIKDDKEYVPKIIKTNPSKDMAILQVKELSGNPEFAEFREVEVGNDCLIFGYPLNLPHLTLSKGTVSAKGNRLGTKFPFELFQVDARINYGNSGGPVFQSNTGKVIGIVTAKYIPFLDRVAELQEFVATIPTAPTNAGVNIQGINMGAFYNYVNESVKRITDSLMLVQVGIGWVIPISLFSQFANE